MVVLCIGDRTGGDGIFHISDVLVNAMSNCGYCNVAINSITSVSNKFNYKCYNIYAWLNTVESFSVIAANVCDLTKFCCWLGHNFVVVATDFDVMIFFQLYYKLCGFILFISGYFY